jgi:hypothetical protein
METRNLDQGANNNLKNKNCYTSHDGPFFGCSAAFNHENRKERCHFSKLLTRNIDFLDKKGGRTLGFATYSDCLEISQLYLDDGANFEQRNSNME